MSASRGSLNNECLMTSIQRRPCPTRRAQAGLIVLTACAAGATIDAMANPYPARPVRLIVPFAPGGGADNLARTLHAAAIDALGQTIVIDNRGGGGGTIGTDLVAKAPPDGYTIALVTTGHTVNPSLLPKVPYDAYNHFEPISLLATQPNVLVVHPSVGARSVQELVALAKAKPGVINFASGGNGSSPHLSGELLKLATGVAINHIPYKGAGPGIADVVAGHVHMMFVGPISIEAYVRAGRLRALAVADAKRLTIAPDIPTMAEAGFTGIETGTWYALLAPAGTPSAVVARLHATFTGVLRAPEMTARLNKQGMDVVAGSPAELRNFMKAELAKWSRVVKAAKLRVDCAFDQARKNIEPLQGASTVSRIPTADPDQDPILKDAYEQITRTRGYVSNILASLSNAPEGLKRFAAFGEYVRYEVTIPGRTRELVILAIARGIEYGWVHHYPHARKAGVTEDELSQLKTGALASTLRPDERAAIVYAQEFASGGNVADATFAALKQFFTARQITDITLVCAYFIGLGSIMNAFRVELEPDSQLAKRIERAD